MKEVHEHRGGNLLLKLKHLFANTDLATFVVKNWEYENLDYFQYWRVSANAIYPFQNKDGICYLRMAPVGEKEENDIRAELEFLNYLKSEGFKAIEPVPSNNGNDLELVDTPWGTYYGAVFKKASGKSLEDADLTLETVHQYGAKLGKLHNLSQHYQPKTHKRKSWLDILNWIEQLLSEFPNEHKALLEVHILKECFAFMEVTEDNFGLIHYDFEFDNVFYDAETNEITPIDFDDAMYHWYGMDVEQAIDSLKDCDKFDDIDNAVEEFIKGYRSERALSEEMLNNSQVFRRFANLYGYARILRSAEEQWDNEPDWLINLRRKFSNLLENRRATFGLDRNRCGSEK